jgi:phasin family protein
MLQRTKSSVMLHRSNSANTNHRGFVMNEQMFSAFQGQSEKLLGPSRDLNKLAIAKLEQLASLQIASLREYTELNLSQLKAASDITSAADIQEYFGKQKDFLKTVGEKLAGDAQAMAALGKEFVQEAQKIGRDSMTMGKDAA